MHILRTHFGGRKMAVTRPKIIRKSIFLVFHKLLIISSKTSKKVRKKIFRAVFEVQKTYFCHFSNGFFGFQNVQKLPYLGYAPTCRGWLGRDKNRKNPKSPKICLNTQKPLFLPRLGQSGSFWSRQVPYTSPYAINDLKCRRGGDGITWNLTYVIFQVTPPGHFPWKYAIFSKKSKIF